MERRSREIVDSVHKDNRWIRSEAGYDGILEHGLKLSVCTVRQRSRGLQSSKMTRRGLSRVERFRSERIANCGLDSRMDSLFGVGLDYYSVK